MDRYSLIVKGDAAQATAAARAHGVAIERVGPGLTGETVVTGIAAQAQVEAWHDPEFEKWHAAEPGTLKFWRPIGRVRT